MVEKPLFDRDLGLTGKPDYLVEQNGKIIPVEVKTGRTPEAPYDSHIFQVAAYCLAGPKNNRQTSAARYHPLSRPRLRRGLHPELENALLDLIADMRIDEHRAEVHRSHEDEQRCRRCGFRDGCDQKLA